MTDYIDHYLYARLISLLTILDDVLFYNSTLWASVHQSNCLIIPEKMAELWICLFVNNISSSECNCEYPTVETMFL